MLFLLVLLLIALTLDCHRITESENNVIREKCGVRSLKKKASFKIFGGRGVRSGEYPWLVHIIISKHLGDEVEEETCTGSLISPSHVLTAAHCVTDYDAEKDVPCDGRERVLNVPTVKPQYLEVYTGTFCRHQEDCENRQRVRKVIAHKNWKRCVQSSAYNGELQVHDFAILELEKNVSYKEAVPICLPSGNLRLQRALRGAGSGRDSKSLEPGLKVATLKLYAEEHSSPMILTSSKDTSACGGDSGGPLFQLGPSARFVIVGVLSGGYGSTDCEKPYDANTYGDVRQHLKWICTHTGVCPKGDSVQERT